MNCNVIISHSKMSKKQFRGRLAKVFGSDSLPYGAFHKCSVKFADFPELQKSVLYHNKIHNITYSFLILDVNNTQIWCECSEGTDTFTEFERIVTNGILAIKQSFLPKRCSLSSCRIYEKDEADSLPLNMSIISFFSELEGIFKKENLIFIFLTWLIAVLIVYMIPSEFEKGASIWYNPSLYAPAGALLTATIRSFYNSIRSGKKVIIHVNR